MSTMFQIAWRNKISGTTGLGPKQFDEAHGKAVVDELNEEYSDFEHVLQPAGSTEKAEFKSLPAPMPTVQFQPLTDSDPMPFGVHATKPMARVPSDYLDWLSGQRDLMKAWPQVEAYVAANREAIDQDMRNESRE